MEYDFYLFHSVGNFRIPTDLFLYVSEGLKPPGIETVWNSLFSMISKLRLPYRLVLYTLGDMIWQSVFPRGDTLSVLHLFQPGRCTADTLNGCTLSTFLRTEKWHIEWRLLIPSRLNCLVLSTPGFKPGLILVISRWNTPSSIPFSWIMLFKIYLTSLSKLPTAYYCSIRFWVIFVDLRLCKTSARQIISFRDVRPVRRSRSWALMSTFSPYIRLLSRLNLCMGLISMISHYYPINITKTY